MKAEYVQAVETRLQWLRWAEREGRQVFAREGYSRIEGTYLSVLRSADMYYMSTPFAALVDHARQSVPDDLCFDATWVQSKRGWLWLHDPFVVPETELPAAGQYAPQHPVTIRALGWYTIPVGAQLLSHKGDTSETVSAPGAVQFCFFMESFLSPGEFWPWSYFVLRDGQVLGDRIEEFETVSRTTPGAAMYVPAEGRRTHPLHEMRWLYTALHLMAQRLTSTSRVDVDRATRRRAERNRQQAPPLIQVVTLRRLEEARTADRPSDHVDWQWQWSVRGHWRNQPYGEGRAQHRQVFIESYIKGPPDKPLKPGALKLFAAAR